MNEATFHSSTLNSLVCFEPNLTIYFKASFMWTQHKARFTRASFCCRDSANITTVCTSVRTYVLWDCDCTCACDCESDCDWGWGDGGRAGLMVWITWLWLLGCWIPGRRSGSWIRFDAQAHTVQSIPATWRPPISTHTTMYIWDTGYGTVTVHSLE